MISHEKILAGNINLHKVKGTKEQNMNMGIG
jgi:hypothetical protein